MANKPSACKRGHPAPVRNKWGACKLCLNVTRAEWARRNPAKRNAAQRKWDRANPEKVRAVHRKYRYGITAAQVAEKLERQNHVCAICGTTPSRFVADHNHKTGAFRGMLCSNCNTGIGLLKDDADIIEQAAHYLRDA